MQRKAAFGDKPVRAPYAQIRVLPGDCVKVERPAYDLQRGRIVFRFR